MMATEDTSPSTQFNPSQLVMDDELQEKGAMFRDFLTSRVSARLMGTDNVFNLL